MPTPSAILGAFGEDRVSQLISSQGMTIQNRGWRDKHKEIDIIALGPDGKLHFVEVKTRTKREGFRPEAAFTVKKLQNIMAAANRYVELHNINAEITIDLAVVNCSDNNNEIIIYPDVWQSFSYDCYAS